MTSSCWHHTSKITTFLFPHFLPFFQFIVLCLITDRLTHPWGLFEYLKIHVRLEWYEFKLEFKSLLKFVSDWKIINIFLHMTQLLNYCFRSRNSWLIIWSSSIQYSSCHYRSRLNHSHRVDSFTLSSSALLTKQTLRFSQGSNLST